jgi:hypothetical protein
MDNQSREYAQQSLTLPHDVVPLPSGGVFYRNKKQSVKVGYLTAMDENILLGGTGDLASNLLRAKIYEPDFRVDDMIEGDIEAILIFLRNTSFGPELNVTATDPSTGKQFQTTVLLDQLTILKGQEPNPDGTFTVTLPKSQSTVKLKPLTFGELNAMNKSLESYPAGRVPPKITTRLQKEIVEVGGITDVGEIAKFVEQLPIADSKFIRKFMNENEPKLDLKKTIQAPSGEKLTVNVGFGVDFFRPFF